MKRPAAPMRRHLSAAARRIGGRAYGLQHHVVRRNTKSQAQGAIAIVREEPVVPRPERQRCADLQRFMARGRDLEEDFLLALEENFAVVYRAGQKHQPVDFNQLLRRQVPRSRIGSGCTSAGNCRFHSRQTPIAKPEQLSLIPDAASLIVAIPKNEFPRTESGSEPSGAER